MKKHMCLLIINFKEIFLISKLSSSLGPNSVLNLPIDTKEKVVNILWSTQGNC